MSTTVEREVHPVADMFPLVPQGELQELAKSIADVGLLDPISTLDGVVIDGRNRLRACAMAGVEPDFREVDLGDIDVIDWIVAKNLPRRHLNASQKAMVAAAIARFRKGANQHRQDDDEEDAQRCAPSVSQTAAAKKVGASRRSVQHAREVLDEGAPELASAVKSGAVPVSVAATAARAPKTRQLKALQHGAKGVKKLAKEVECEEQQAVDPMSLATNGKKLTGLVAQLAKLCHDLRIVSATGPGDVSERLLESYLTKAKPHVKDPVTWTAAPKVVAKVMKALAPIADRVYGGKS